MNRFIIADANKYTGCRTCEVTCVVSHQDNQDCASLTPETFLPCIHVIKDVNVSMTALCCQCEDAPYTNICPNSAVNRDKDFVHAIQERYIGCRAYVVTCLYGAMEVVVRPVIRNSGVGPNVRAEKVGANKHDPYHHREAGSVCIEVYPTHALVYVDRNRFKRLSTKERRRTAPDSTTSLLL